uniref:Uncharacterized protein n=1 Tax=Aegilops tauschii subsp. strangulata TaxID=200361 RepID=A0A453K4K0_AEGTS
SICIHRQDRAPHFGDPAANCARPDGRRSMRSRFRGAARCRRLLFATELCSPPYASGSGCPRILPCHGRLSSLPPRPALVALLDWHRR